ncbi:MAG: dephospho-CoA kinase, partial [Planctomycetota bacterium]
HPAIRDEIRNQIRNAPQDADAVILDAALLLESGWAAECDAIVMVDTPLPLRQRRVRETRGWSTEEHTRREAAQWPLDQKRAVSMCVVDNSGSPDDAAAQMESCVRTILTRV